MTRYAKLDLPTYWAGINPQLIAEFTPNGAVAKVTISYPRDYMRQQLAYAFENRHARPHPRPQPSRVLQ